MELDANSVRRCVKGRHFLTDISSVSDLPFVHLKSESGPNSCKSGIEHGIFIDFVSPDESQKLFSYLLPSFLICPYFGSGNFRIISFRSLPNQISILDGCILFLRIRRIREEEALPS